MDFKELTEIEPIKVVNHETEYNPYVWASTHSFTADITDTILKQLRTDINYSVNIIPYFKIKKVIFNNPATIVYWGDGTKTVVKCGEREAYDEEKGLALCFMKKALNNKGNYNNLFRKYIKEKKDAES